MLHDMENDEEYTSHPPGDRKISDNKRDQGERTNSAGQDTQMNEKITKKRPIMATSIPNYNKYPPEPKKRVECTLAQTYQAGTLWQQIAP